MGVSTDLVTFEPDRPFLGVSVNDKAELQCCYTPQHDKGPTWVVSYRAGNTTRVPLGVNNLKYGTAVRPLKDGGCGVLTLYSAQLNDTGMYHCVVNASRHSTEAPGTYLQVYSECAHSTSLKCQRVALKCRDGVKRALRTTNTT